MPDRVLLDANVWISNPLLRTPLGDALLHRLSHNLHSIVLPDIVVQEVSKNLRARVAESSAQVASKLSLMSTIFARPYELVLPTAEDVGAAMETRFNELKGVIHNVSMDLGHARRALNRVLDGTSPNTSKNQQFKDSAIWEIALESAQHGPLHLVTEDRGFYESSDYAQGLASQLRSEAERLGRTVLIYPSLKALLDELTTQPPMVDVISIAEAIFSAIDPALQAFALSKGFAVGERGGAKVSAFPTAAYARIAVSAEGTYVASTVPTVSDQQAPPSTDSLVVEADSGFDVTAHVPIKPRLRAVRYFSASGVFVPEKSGMFLYAGPA